MFGKSLLLHFVTSLECYYFYTHVSNCVMGATPMSEVHLNICSRHRNQTTCWYLCLDIDMTKEGKNTIKGA